MTICISFHENYEILKIFLKFNLYYLLLDPTPPGQAPRSNNASVVKWSKPSKPHGRVEFYEVAVTQKRRDEVIRQRISTIMNGETSCFFTKIPLCLGTEYQTTVEVRAVNAALLTHETMDGVRVSHTTQDAYNYNYNNEDNDDLICNAEGRHTKESNEQLQRYMDTTKYRLYKSAWQTSTIYSCSTSRMSKITTSALVVVAMSLSVMAALYMARKKYNKMANINCTLPAGLETYFTKDCSGFTGDFVATQQKTFDSETKAAEDQWISAARMHEFNFRNEHHHLLASLGNDSGYLGGGGTVCMDSGDAVNKRNLSCSLETNNVTDDSVESPENNEDEEENYKTQQHINCFTSNVSSSVDSLVESTEESDTPNSDAEQEALTVFPHTANGYVKQSMLQPWQNFHDDNRSQPNNTGYITVQSLNAGVNTMASPPTSGYVMQQDLQKFFKNSISQQNTFTPTATALNTNTLSPITNGGGGGGDGYTTFDDLSRLNLKPIAGPQTSDKNQPLENINNLRSGNTAAHDINSKTNNTGAGEGGGGISGCISGYVTQQDLNIFAQHQQH